jgi:hypothetical protein
MVHEPLRPPAFLRADGAQTEPTPGWLQAELDSLAQTNREPRLLSTLVYWASRVRARWSGTGPSAH